MGWSTPDVYGEPEKFGLEIVAECDEPGLSYEFNMFLILRDPSTGEVFYASDSGCSCPSPFERYTSRDDLTKAGTAQDLHNALHSWAYGFWQDPDMVEAHAKISDLHFPLKGQVVRGEIAA